MAMSSGRDNEAKAARFMEDGEKCLTKWSLFGSSTKFEDAAELFEKAGRLYKVARNMDAAAAAYERAAENFEKANSAHESARSHVEAAKCKKEAGSSEAVDSYRKAIEIFNESGRFQQAGKMLTEIGDIYKEEGNYSEAVEAWQEASDYLASENSSSQANACLVKVAAAVSKDMEPPQLGRAATIYERLGRSCMEKKLLQMNAKGYWLQAGLCLLAQGDTVGARQKLSDFTDADHTFEDSREFRFFQNLIQASEDNDVEALSQHCFEYDEISKLDPWKTSMCLRIKRSIEAMADPDNEDIDLR
ncbi:unnamed protein product [Ascophyllum nodosum]